MCDGLSISWFSVSARLASSVDHVVAVSIAVSEVLAESENRFGDDAYAMEELIAELGAAFLCADLTITNAPRPDHAAYVASWLKVLSDDTRAIFTAAAKAHAAADFLIGLQKSAYPHRGKAAQ
jgi:antirestriction protein ArdC